MNTAPFLSVLMPVYNAERFLHESIDSVLTQTYSHFELLIINDGSTDNSEKVIFSYTDKRIRYVKNESNLGLIATLNKGIELIAGKYIARMDADDICLPDRFKKQLEFLDAHPDVGICGCCADVIDKKNLRMKYDAEDASIRIKMLYQCHMLHPSVIIRKEVVDKFRLRFNPEYLHAEDYDFFYRIGKVTKLANLNEVLLLYREHEGSVSRIYYETQKKNSRKVIKKEFVDVGLEITDAEIDLFQDFMNSRFDFAENELYTIEKLLMKIIQANQYSENLDEATLTSIFFQKWKVMLINVSRFGLNIYQWGINSPLMQYGNFSILERVKFFAKATLKY